MQPDDAYWRRPAETSSAAGPAQNPYPTAFLADQPPTAAAHPPGLSPSSRADLPNLVYQGPPLWSAPPAGWRPAHVVQPAPPRRLPEQNHAAIDEQEAKARTLSLGLAIVAGSIMVIVLCALCGRTLF